MEFRRFQQLSQFDPVVKVIEILGLVLRVLPQSRRLMATAYGIGNCCLAIYSQQGKFQERNSHISTKALRMRLFFPVPEAVVVFSADIVVALSKFLGEYVFYLTDGHQRRLPL
jgi:hypothetical protein